MIVVLLCEEEDYLKLLFGEKKEEEEEHRRQKHSPNPKMMPSWGSLLRRIPPLFIEFEQKTRFGPAVLLAKVFFLSKVCREKEEEEEVLLLISTFLQPKQQTMIVRKNQTKKSRNFSTCTLKHFCTLGVFLPVYSSRAIAPPSGYHRASSKHGKFDGENVSVFIDAASGELVEVCGFVRTGVFAHGGVIAAGKRGLDLLGCVVVGCVTAMGGGTIRGALIGIEGAHPVFWIAEPEYLIVALVASFFTFFLWPKVLSKEVRESKAMETALNWLDALSLGGFCIIGANAALVRNLGPLLAVALSAITCTGGGVVRDVFLRQPVRVLHSHAELYGTTAIAGAAVYTVFACWFPGVSHNLRCLLAAFTTVFLRWRAWKRFEPMYSDVNPDLVITSLSRKRRLDLIDTMISVVVVVVIFILVCI